MDVFKGLILFDFVIFFVFFCEYILSSEYLCYLVLNELY